jgi:integrase
MAKIIRRVWTTQGPTGRKVRHVAYGYTLMVNGKQERKVSSAWGTEADALEALAARQKEVGAGCLKRPADRTLAELAKEYIRYKGDHGKRSLADDQRILEKRLLPALGSTLPVRTLTAAAIAQYERTRMGATVEGRDRKVSAFTVSNELSVLRHMLRLARRWGYLDAVPDVELPRKPEGRRRYLEADEITRLRDACQRSGNPDLALAVVIALNTGMRKAEILGLEWARIDLSTARITLYATKSGKPRGIPVNSDVYDALVACQPGAEQRQGRLFSRDYGRRASQIRKAFEVACRRAGIAGFRFHDLRHTAASHLVMRGATLQEVKEILGHSDIRMTLRYAHLSPAHLRSAVERLEGLGRPSLAAPIAQESAHNAPSDLVETVKPARMKA